ncbi:DNA polymerase [Gordonia phage Phendrix]|uniref:DNA polymerase n=1 Tax=Gordonia phage Phendrix TaxID=2593335 RepID=A0A514U194_9CAUD|nr:DNA polymerase [Gordonia phage Phendrix]QDK02692.1 DNA polymerase [Gordonia phage Phendrix]
MPWPEEKPLKETVIGTVDTVDDVFEFKRWLGQKRDVLALDTETMGLDPYASNAGIRLFQCGDVNEAWVIDAHKWPGLIYEVLENYEGPQVWHNIAFDAKYVQVVLPDLKFPWSLSHDTLIAHRLHDNEAPAALKTVSAKLFGSAATAGQRMLDATMENTGTDWDTVPLDAPAYRIYSGVDVILTARLYRRMSHVIHGEFKSSYDLEMQSRRICTNMELKGMRLDADYCREKRDVLADYVEKTLDWGQKHYGIKLSSSRQLGQWLIDNDVPILEWTGSGFPKTDEENLEAYTKQGLEIADVTLKMRKAAKIVNSYLDNFIKYSENSGDIVHPAIDTMAARTGRMSIRKPALQTLSRTETTVRGSFIPHEGHVLLSSDLDQVELRLAGCLSHDPSLIEDFYLADTTGVDFFTNSGRALYHDPEMIKGDPRRDTVKTYWYSSLYGAGVSKMALAAGVPEVEMREVAMQVKERYSELERYKGAMAGSINAMTRSGERPYVTTAYGRRLYVPPEKAYVGVNYAIQGTAAEILKRNLVDLDMSGLSDYLVVPVHDEILLSVPDNKDLIDDVQHTVAECMTEEGFDIPLTADCSSPMQRWKKG